MAHAVQEHRYTKKNRYNMTSTTIRTEIASCMCKGSFSHFLTIHVPLCQKTTNINTALKQISFILRRFEKHLISRNRWYNKFSDFIMVIESGQSGTYHYHILGNFINPQTNNTFSEQDIQNALFSTNSLFKQKFQTDADLDYVLKPIQTQQYLLNLAKYITKQLTKYNFSDRFWPAVLLFDSDKCKSFAPCLPTIQPEQIAAKKPAVTTSESKHPKNRSRLRNVLTDRFYRCQRALYPLGRFLMRLLHYLCPRHQRKPPD